jgi:hypothetical protein
MKKERTMRITGEYDEADWYGVVLVDGRRLSPTRSLKVFNHSPTGFAWGYAGSGPAQLALAILLEAGLSRDEAVALHHDFKREFIQGLPRGAFSLDVDVSRWADAKKEEPRP